MRTGAPKVGKADGPKDARLLSVRQAKRAASMLLKARQNFANHENPRAFDRGWKLLVATEWMIRTVLKQRGRRA